MLITHKVCSAHTHTKIEICTSLLFYCITLQWLSSFPAVGIVWRRRGSRRGLWIQVFFSITASANSRSGVETNRKNSEKSKSNSVICSSVRVKIMCKAIMSYLFAAANFVHIFSYVWMCVCARLFYRIMHAQKIQTLILIYFRFWWCFFILASFNLSPHWFLFIIVQKILEHERGDESWEGKSKEISSSS